MSAQEKVIVVVPWHDQKQRDRFCEAWHITHDYPNVMLVQDQDHEGCAATKNKGVEVAIHQGADIVVVLDDDCFPSPKHTIYSIANLIDAHRDALNTAALCNMVKQVTEPQSRGTPYYHRHIVRLPAASMGFWEEIGDYDAPSQLVHGANKVMTFDQNPVDGQYFPLCGMNLAFRPRQWLPWCRFINVPRFDDIWMGWLWQKKAYAEGYYFNLNGPVVRHSRQSNVWANLRVEAKYLEENETVWSKIAQSPSLDYDELLRLLPFP